MSKRHLFLATFITFLAILPPTSSGHCQLFPSSVCSKQTTFVPGHNFIGEGVDITTLEKKGAFVVDSSSWQDPNGTCTLCQNPLMDGQLQKLPIAAVDWRVRRSCHRQVSGSVENSDVDVANAMATEVKNDWKVELGLATEISDSEAEPRLPEAQMAFAGSRSRMAIYAHEQSQKDSYSFVRQEVSCEYYRLRLLQRPSLLAFHFSHAVAGLPRKNDPEAYQHFINIYGTHYISHVQLGGRVRHLLAVQTCKMALWGFTASMIKQCLTLEASLQYARLYGSTALSSKCKELLRDHTSGIFHEIYGKQLTEVVGGDKQVEMLFSGAQDVHRFSEWMESAKSKPGLVAYSLLPLHSLMNQTDPRRDLLKQAIVGHIKQRSLRRDCPQKCPHWHSQSSEDHCICLCEPAINTKMCCASEWGNAHLKFYVRRGSNLWGDHFSATDAFVKVLFQGQEKRTRVIYNNNDPNWYETLDFGAVTLASQNSFEVQLWDKEVLHDDLLQSCSEKLEARASAVWHKCYAPHGHFEYYYLLECAHTLGGPSCHDYVPLQLPASYFN
ncbi:perforin-1-like [Rhineura floridana]|uniref:perforin-1-like n=1 Tax=Rhineura floridana TaxID=261503 RepID=UPI002AC81A68|nr:perforin-1-like [Rhineura floridana]XP_061445930.1 perforin-1-like [Rhineura floridana]XP_061445931.1 perforin-1-like [Rhineura floridana]XP_061445932.1 perforin-1-like [Rhineura floridana]